MFVPSRPGVRVNLAVVSLGTPDRLFRCLDALLIHEAVPDFTVTVVVNAAGPDLDRQPWPDGVQVVPVLGNLGWAGGLHRARAATDAELFAWVQDDMVPLPGWLDALVEAADAHPRAGALGAVGTNADSMSAGFARPRDDVQRWNETDVPRAKQSADVASYDWVTSKGMLTRTAAWDDVSGTDPRRWPLNHVDKDYCTHLRCHGWDVVLVPGATLRHAGALSAPGLLRRHLLSEEASFNALWGPPLALLETGAVTGQVPHPCATWRHTSADAVAAAVGEVASTMLVPFSRFAVADADARVAYAEAHGKVGWDHLEHARNDARIALERVDELETRARRLRVRKRRLDARVADLQQQLEAVTSSRSWRLTRPLRGLGRRRSDAL